MRAVVQRVRTGSVTIEGKEFSRIGPGIVVLLGVGQGDNEEDAGFLAEKIVNLRIFEDTYGKMNLSLSDVGGELLAVSQFTLYGDCRKGRRPGFSDAAAPGEAKRLYEVFIDESEEGIAVSTGSSQEHMLVDMPIGPVTLFWTVAGCFEELTLLYR